MVLFLRSLARQLVAWCIIVGFICYRDKTEPLKVLTSEEKKELQQRENARSRLLSAAFCYLSFILQCSV